MGFSKFWSNRARRLLPRAWVAVVITAVLQSAKLLPAHRQPQRALLVVHVLLELALDPHYVRLERQRRSDAAARPLLVACGRGAVLHRLPDPPLPGVPLSQVAGLGGLVGARGRLLRGVLDHRSGRLHVRLCVDGRQDARDPARLAPGLRGAQRPVRTLPRSTRGAAGPRRCRCTVAARAGDHVVHHRRRAHRRDSLLPPPAPTRARFGRFRGAGGERADDLHHSRMSPAVVAQPPRVVAPSPCPGPRHLWRVRVPVHRDPAPHWAANPHSQRVSPVPGAHGGPGHHGVGVIPCPRATDPPPSRRVGTTHRHCISSLQPR